MSFNNSYRAFGDTAYSGASRSISAIAYISFYGDPTRFGINTSIGAAVGSDLSIDLI